MNSPKESGRVSALDKSLPWLWFVLAFLIILFDQWTKHLTVANLALYQKIEITSFFNLTHRYNYGVAFSIFDDIDGGQRWPLAALACAVSIGIVIWIVRIGKRLTFEVAGLALVLGGAVGNLYDRVMLGYVVDFIEVHYGGYYWPAFNVADSSICVGAALIILDSFKAQGQNKSEKS